MTGTLVRFKVYSLTKGVSESLGSQGDQLLSELRALRA